MDTQTAPTTYQSYRVFNHHSRKYGTLYGGLNTDALERALFDADTRKGDRIELQIVFYELAQQGERRIDGSTIFEPRMVKKETGVKTVRAGVVTKYSIAAGYRNDNQPIASWTV